MLVFSGAALRALVLVLLIGAPLTPSISSADSDEWYGGTFAGTGWVLLRVDATEQTRIQWHASNREGYVAFMRAAFFENGSISQGGALLAPDIAPGVYLDAGTHGDVVVAPNPATPGTSQTGTAIDLARPGWPTGTFYVFAAVAGEVSSWNLDAPRSTLVASGPMNFKWGFDLDGEPYVEANAGLSSASASTGDRQLSFEVEDALIGQFGMGPYGLLVPGLRSGNATLTFPDGTLHECTCLVPWVGQGGPGTYVYRDNRTMIAPTRAPAAFWADVPFPWLA